MLAANFIFTTLAVFSLSLSMSSSDNYYFLKKHPDIHFKQHLCTSKNVEFWNDKLIILHVNYNPSPEQKVTYNTFTSTWLFVSSGSQNQLLNHSEHPH